MRLKTFLFTCLLWVTIEFSESSELCKKHVVIILADDLGWNDVSFHGSDQFLTPNLDALAYSGVILHNYYVMQVCSPSRSALMTGIHPINTGMYHDVIQAADANGLPLDLKILPQYLKDYGYKTHAVGKWHLGFCKETYTPTKRGFDSHFGHWTGHEDYYNHRSDLLYMIGDDFRRGMDQVACEYKGQYSTDLFTAEAVDIIHNHDTDDPLFLYLAPSAVHVATPNDPLPAPREIIDKFSYIKDEKRRIFAAMVWKLDESVGKVVQALGRKNMLENTIIIFSTDNGGPAGGLNQNAASNWPLKGVKNTLWEGGVRGTALVWSADLPRNTANNDLMHIQDWLPTILGAISECGTNSSAEIQGLDGHNMWPVLKGERPSEYDELLLQRDDLSSISAIRKRNWKLIQGVTQEGHYDQWFGPSGRDKSYSYNLTEIVQSPVAKTLQARFSFPTESQIISLRRNVTLDCNYCGVNGAECTPCALEKEACLFDIFNDPCERNNLAEKNPDVLKDMIDMIRKYKPVPALNANPDWRANPIYWNNTWTNWLDYVTKDSSNLSTVSSKTLIVRKILHQDKLFKEQVVISNE